MNAPRLLIFNGTSHELHLIVRPINGQLVVLMFPATLPKCVDLPPGAAIDIYDEDALRSCMDGSMLRFRGRNKSGLDLEMAMGIDPESKVPAIVFREAGPDDEDDGDGG